MIHSESTCWSLIGGAAAGNTADRDLFARRYATIIRSYLVARWRNPTMAREIEDAVQEVLLECFRQGGALDRLDPELASSFRSYLFGVTRNVARNRERAVARRHEEPLPNESDIAGGSEQDETPSRAFDLAWARAVLREAAEHQAARARTMGRAEVERVELLRLRFWEGLPIREIARRWNRDPKEIHRAYPQARKDFETAVQEVLASYHRGSKDAVEREWATLRTLIH